VAQLIPIVVSRASGPSVSSGRTAGWGSWCGRLAGDHALDRGLLPDQRAAQRL